MVLKTVSASVVGLPVAPTYRVISASTSEPNMSAISQAKAAVVSVQAVPSSSVCQYVWTPSGEMSPKIAQFQ